MVHYITQGVFKSPESGSHPGPIELESPVDRTEIFKYFQAPQNSHLRSCVKTVRVGPTQHLNLIKLGLYLLGLLMLVWHGLSKTLTCWWDMKCTMYLSIKQSEGPVPMQICAGEIWNGNPRLCVSWLSMFHNTILYLIFFSYDLTCEFLSWEESRDRENRKLTP